MGRYLAIFVVIFGLSFLSCTKSCDQPKENLAKPRVFFISPENNSVVSSPLFVKFGVTGKKLEPALKVVKYPVDPTSGHHHILIDSIQNFIPRGQAVPKDKKHIHFGKAESETKLHLKPGIHTLTLQFADGAHISYGEPLSATITVEVQESSK